MGYKISFEGLPMWSIEPPIEPGEYWFSRNGVEEVQYKDIRLSFDNRLVELNDEYEWDITQNHGTWMKVTKPLPPGHM